MSAAPRLAAALAAVAVGLGACGDDPATPPETTTASAEPQRLTGAERADVRRAEAAILRYCRRVANSVTGSGNPPSASEQSRALSAVDELVALAAAKPEAKVSAGVGLRLALGDLAENLEGSNCDPAIVARLDAGLASPPSP